MQTSQTKVSVIVPVYNVEKLVGQCMESLITQTFKDIEVVVVDDCSPDKSMQVVNGYAENDSRIRIVTHEKNRGLMQARRTGYIEAKGDYVVFCDSDDVLPHNAIELLYNEAVASLADVVSGDMTLFYPDSGCEQLRKSHLSFGTDMISVYKSLLTSEYHHNLCGKIFRTSLLQDNKYKTVENFTNGEDGYLFYQVMENVCKVVHINESVYCYRQNMQSSTKVRLGENAIRSICMLNQLRVQLAERHPEIQKYALSKVTSVLNSLYSEGYGKDAGLDDCVAEFGLAPYSSLLSVFKFVSFPKSCKLAAKRLKGLL